MLIFAQFFLTFNDFTSALFSMPASLDFKSALQYLRLDNIFTSRHMFTLIFRRSFRAE